MPSNRSTWLEEMRAKAAGEDEEEAVAGASVRGDWVRSMQEQAAQADDFDPGQQLGVGGPAEGFAWGLRSGTSWLSQPVGEAMDFIGNIPELARYGAETLQGEDPELDYRREFSERPPAREDMSESARTAEIPGRIMGEAMSFAGGVSALGQVGRLGAQGVSRLVPSAAPMLRSPKPGAVPYTQVLHGTATSNTPSWLQPIVAQANQSPRAFLATEASAAASAGAAATTASQVFPGNETVQLGAEVAGGMANPVGSITRLFRGTAREAPATFRLFTRAGREDKAAHIISRVAEATGENLETVAKRMAEVGESQGKLTPAQMTNSRTWAAIESKLGEAYPHFAGQKKENFIKAHEELGKLASRLASTGDPQNLVMAAEIRRAHIEDILSDRFKRAQVRAAEAASKVSGKGTGEASRAATEVLRKEFDAAKKIETELWNKVDRDIPVGNVEPLQDALTTLRQRVRQEKAVPFQDSLERIVNDGQTTTGELLNIRREALSNARQLRKGTAEGGDFDAALNEIVADSISQQLSDVDAPGLDVARTYTRTLHETFDSGLAGKVTGGRPPPDETVLGSAMSGQGDAARVKMRELSDAAGFLAEDAMGAMRDEQEQFLRSHAGKFIENGQVNPTRLRTFVRNNEALLDDFPALKQDLQDAETAEVLARDTQKQNEKGLKIASQRAVFGNLLGTKNPEAVVRGVLKQSKPSLRYRQLAKLAEREGKEAMEGLKTATLEDIVKRSTTPQGDISFERMKILLDDPIQTGQPAVLELMRRNGVISAPDSARLLKVVKRGAEIEDVMKDPTRADKLIEEADYLTDLVIRMGGAGAMSYARRALGVTDSGSSIQMAAAGAQGARNLFAKAPRTKVNNILLEAADNPRFAQFLTEKAAKYTDQPRMREGLRRQVNGYLLQAGIPVEDQEEANEQGIGPEFPDLPAYGQ